MFIPLRGFGKYGVIHDTLSQSLPIGTWSDARNVRFVGNAIEKMLEPETVMSAPVNPEWMQGWSDGLSSYLAVATPTELWFWKASSPSNGVWVEATRWIDETDETQGRKTYNPDGRWHSFQWGDTVIFNNGVDAPQIWNNSYLRFEDLPGWGLISTANDISQDLPPSRDTFPTARVLLPYKNYLVALGVTENGAYSPNKVWWSDATSHATYASSVANGGPPSWDYESPATLSGQSEVGLGEGAITWGGLLNENLIIYTEASATAMQLVGGPLVMSFRRLFSKGCAGMFLAVEFNNQHFVVARDQIYVHDGSTVHLIARDRVEEEFFKRAGKGGRFGSGDIDFEQMQLVKNPDRKEIYLAYAEDAT